jgi:hypothetical protein
VNRRAGNSPERFDHHGPVARRDVPGLLLGWNNTLTGMMMMAVALSFVVYLFYRMKIDDASDK